jgi:trehalose synthase-fused probable maltokinase
MDRFLGSWTAQAPLRAALENRLLPDWLPERRWFQSKSRRLRQVRIKDGGTLWSVEGLALLLAYVDAEADDGVHSLYQLPLVVSRDDPGGLPPAALLGMVDHEGFSLRVIDGLAIPAVPLWFVNQMVGQLSWAAERGGLAAARTGKLHELMGEQVPEPIRVSGAEQSHSNVILGDRLLLKVFRKLDAGRNPDLEIGQVLTERTAFRNIPRLGGSVLYRSSDGVEYGAALLQEFIPSRGQGWEWMLGLLGEAFEHTGKTGMVSADALDQLVADAGLLGRRTAELHAALARIADDSAFAPQPFTADDWRASESAILAQAERTRCSLAHLDDPPETLRPQAEALLQAIPAWLDSPDQHVPHTDLGQKIRVHGDYHLGQTLRTESDYILLDFEGEPSRPIAERRRKQSPLRDWAGMVRSFDYAVYSALDTTCRRVPECSSTFHALAPAFRQAMIDAFEGSYLELASGAAWFPAESAGRALLARLLVEKVVYELDYELNNRPDWATIPLRGLRDLVTGVKGP